MGSHLDFYKGCKVVNFLFGNERVIYYNTSNWLQRRGTFFIRSLTMFNHRRFKISKAKLTFEFQANIEQRNYETIKSKGQACTKVQGSI